MTEQSRNDPPVDNSIESTESQIVRGADTGGDDTDFTLRGDSGETGMHEDLDLAEALALSQAEEPEDT